MNLFENLCMIKESENKEYMVFYVNSIDQNAKIRVKAASETEARKKAKAELGRECQIIHTVVEL